MPFSIDKLSVTSEAQKRVLNNSDRGVCNRLDFGTSDEDNAIYTTEGLVEQEPITVF
ncbi:MAG: hypothetical protein UGF89_01935 [Acutalibacteraceae bacterium]|nr:hypothetical protein [Acutalibacteraceae bacterium]